MRVGKSLVAVAVTVLAAPIGLWCALVAAASLISQVLAGFGVISNANWTQLFSPAVWFGFNNIAGTGSLMDSLVGGPGAPGGSVNRYVVFMLTGFVAAGCYTGIRAAWKWAGASSDE
jgi:hypothetical protein